ncbi:S-adenosylmethionine decarboxylase [Candidatus Woesearchaeota archaeon]|nr:S-adenosylmethionine decarboxylase [Candidatus Woesearchaeota archaeon]
MEGTYLFGYVDTKEEGLLKSAGLIKKAVLGVCKSVGLNVVGEGLYTFPSPAGITYCFILSQSHFVVHTWPEECRVFFDLFTCNKGLDEKKCIKSISDEFNGEVKGVKRVEYR